MKPLVPQDKMDHFVACAAISAWLYLFLLRTSLNEHLIILVAYFTAIAVGCGKELWDRLHGGPFSKGDLIADFIGAVSGVTFIGLVNAFEMLGR